MKVLYTCKIISLLLLLVRVSSPAQIVLPIEVLGPDGTTESVTFQVSDATGVTGLWMQINNLSYDDKASVKINEGPYLNLNNNSVVITGTDKTYGGIGGAFGTLKLTLPLSAGAIKNGSNTISFRFNKSEGITIGYRVVKFNLVDEAGNKLLPKSLFTEEDPATWRAPRPSAADIEAGRVLYETAALIKSPLHSTVTLKARCVDCHAKHGRDLKYFNYSNRSIIERSKFHGLSQEKGEQIASYIRSLDTDAPGRPWNPPYQPGPGQDAKPVSAWAAGAGIDWALDDETQSIPYLFPNGINSEAIATTKTLNLREHPMAMQLLDWKRWLPQVHPKDAFPNDWEDSNMKKSYAEARELLENEKGNPALNRNIWNKLYEYAWVHNEIRDKHKVDKEQDWTREKGVELYSLRQTVAIKLWEMMHEFGMEDDSQAIYGEKAEHRAWSNHSDRMLFEPSPHLIGVPNELGIGGNGITNQYTANAWYQLALIVNAGTGHRADHKVNDHSYSYGVFGDLRNQARKDEPIRFMTYLIKGTQTADNGKTGAGGWNFSVAGPVWLTWSGADKEHWTNPADSEIRRQFVNAYLKTWLEANKKYFPTNIRVGTDGRWTIADANHAPKPINGPGGDWSDYIMDMIVRMRPWGVDCNLLNDIADWGKQVWPKGDWAALKVSCPTAPSNAAVKIDNATVSGGQVSVQASTEHMNATKVEFFVGNEKIGEDTQAPFSITWNDASSGVNQIYAKATDEKGLVMFSNLVPVVAVVAPAYTVSFTIKDAVEDAIKNSTDYTGSVLVEGALVTFNGQTVASDADGVVTFTNVAVGNGLPYSVSKDGYQKATGTVNVLGNLAQTILLSPPTQTVTFIIKDASGAPVANAEVKLWVPGNSGSHSWQVTSDANGVATFTQATQGVLEYEVNKEGYNKANDKLNVATGLASQIIVLTATGVPTYTVSFRVKDAANVPLSGASVSFNGRTITSNASGEAVFNMVAGGSTLTYTVKKMGFSNASGTVNVAADVAQNIVLTASSSPTYIVSFTVKDAANRLVSGASVTFNGQTLTTTDRGVATFANIAPNHSLSYSATKTGFNKAIGTLNVVDDVAENIVLTTSSSPVYTVTFMVKDAASEPVSGASVVFNGQTRATTASGEATFANITPSSNLTYSATKTGYSEASGTVNVAGNVEQNITLNAVGSPVYTVTFTVKDASNALVSDAVVSFNGEDMTTTASGEAVFNNVAPGSDLPYSVSKTGFDSASGALSVASANVTQDVVLTPSIVTNPNPEPEPIPELVAQLNPRNIFSPNGDGVNEVWEVEGIEQQPELRVLIFNGYGQKVYQAQPYTNSWDGAGLPDGVYYFQMLNQEGKPLKKGSITLVR